MKVCPGCGKREDEAPFVGFICLECYRKKKELVSVKELEIKRCPKCGRIFTGRWTDFSLEELKKYVLDRVKTELSDSFVTVSFSEKDGKLVAYITVCGWIEGNRVCEEREEEIHVEKEVCPECSREASGYYEAIIQVRGKDSERISKEVAELVAASGSFVGKNVVRKEGIDLYIGSRKVAEKVAKKMCRKYGGTTKRTFSVYGEKNGKKLVRITIALRIP